MGSDSLTGAKIANWKVAHAAVASRLEELPKLADRHAELGGVIHEAESSQVERKSLESALRVLNRRRRELAVTGEDLRMRLAAVLQSELGFKNEKLITFGVKPRLRARRRGKTEEKPPEAPEAPAQQSGNE
ncbi:MAG TPA: hypothetical protein VE078_18575 [Thermoanaerobaculia bacterium]|nr:hypothetical protein [Thermoanaerobaculia bacterium]